MTSRFEEDYFATAYGDRYDARNPHRKLQFYLDEITRFAPRGQLLDIGCAYGRFLECAGRRFAVTGYDVSAHAVTVARARMPGVEIKQADVLDLPEDRKWDVVTCFDILEHVPKLSLALETLRRALMPGGVLAISVPVYDTLVGRVVRRLDRDPTHIWKRSRFFWERRLAQHRFLVVRKVGLWRYPITKRFHLFFGARFLYRCSPAVLVIGQAT